MSEDHRIDMEQEDLAIAWALESLDPDGAASRPAASAEQQALSRQYVELLGLIPSELEPIVPGPEVEAGLMARIRADGEAVAESHSVARMAAVGSSSGARGWALPLAAVLALLMVGAIWVFASRLAGQQETIDRLAGQLDTANARIDALADLQSRLALVTQAGVEICPLRPTGERPMQPGARAALYVAPDHRSWYLVVEGLPPTPADSSYQVWFAAAEGPVSAGVFESAAGERIEIDSDRMPEGTDGIFITLENRGGDSRPTGDRVLFGDEVMQVL